MWRGSDEGLREILGLWQLKCAKLTVNSQFSGCIQKWIYPEENIFSAPRSYLPDYWKQLFQKVMLVCWICSTSMGQFCPKKEVKQLRFWGLRGLQFFTQSWTTTTRCHENMQRMNSQSFNLAHLFCLESNLPMNAAQVVDSDIWEFCLRAWMQAVKTDQGIGEGRWWEGIAASGKHGLKMFLGSWSTILQQKQGSTQKYIGFRQLDMFLGMFFCSPPKNPH